MLTKCHHLLGEEEDELTVHPERPVVDPRDVHVHSRHVAVEQAQREMFEDRTGEKHMRLNVSFNAQL